VESALRKSAVARQGGADLPRADDADLPLFAEAENLTQLFRQLGDRVAESALAERSEQREVLPDLRRGSPAESGELVAGDRRYSLTLDSLEEAEVEREPPDCRFRDAFQEGL